MILVPWQHAVVEVPVSVVSCPVCGWALSLHVLAWEVETGTPLDEGLELDCERDDCPMVTSYQQNVEIHTKVEAWARSNVRLTGTRDQ